jgi:hypothetical protein
MKSNHILLTSSAIVIVLTMLAIRTSGSTLANATLPPMATPTAHGTSIPLATMALPSLGPVRTVAADAVNSLPTIEAASTSVHEFTNLSDMSADSNVTYLTTSNPFALARGMQIVFSEIPWLNALVTWFFWALVIMVAIEVIAFIILYGGTIIKFVIDVVNLIKP